MATPIWTGAAADVPGVYTITVQDTWANGDAGTVTAGNRGVTLTTDTATVANIATQIKAMLLAGSRTEFNSGSASISAGALQYGEFHDIDDVSVAGAVVTITTKPGKAVTLAVSESTAGTGTLALATVQAPTGKHFWNNAANWSTGSVPANGDTVVFEDTDVNCLYGLPSGSLQPAVVDVRASFTGWLGLPRINRDYPTYPYTEYRQRAPSFDDDNASTTAFYIGRGEGSASPLVNIKQTAGCGAVTVHTTGRPVPAVSSRAFNFAGDASDSFVLQINGGSVAIAEGADEAANISELRSIGGNDRFPPDVVLGPAITQSSTNLVVLSGSVVTHSDFSSYQAIGGEIIVDTESATSVGSARVFGEGGVLRLVNSAAISVIRVGDGGLLDVSGTEGTQSCDTIYVYAGGRIHDPTKKLSLTNYITGDNVKLGDVDIDVGSGSWFLDY